MVKCTGELRNEGTMAYKVRAADGEMEECAVQREKEYAYLVEWYGQGQDEEQVKTLNWR